MLIALAAALALDISGDAGTAAFGLVGTAMAIMLANFYADWLQAEVEQRRRLRPADVPPVVFRSIGVLLGAIPALLLFIAAWLGLLAIATVVDLAVWSGIALLFAFGYVGGRLRGDQQRAAVVHGFLLAVIGFGVMLIKYII